MNSPAVVASDTATIREVARLMLDQGIGGVPMVDASGAPIGMASDGDLMGRRSDDGRRDMVAQDARRRRGPQEIFGPGGERPVREVMSAPIDHHLPRRAGPGNRRGPAGPPHQAAAGDRERPGARGHQPGGPALRRRKRAENRLEEESGAGILGFLESLIGGASLRGLLDARRRVVRGTRRIRRRRRSFRPPPFATTSAHSRRRAPIRKRRRGGRRSSTGAGRSRPCSITT